MLEQIGWEEFGKKNDKAGIVYEIKILGGKSYRRGENGNTRRVSPNFNQCWFCGSFVARRNRLPRARIIIPLSFNRMPDPIQLFPFRLRLYLFLFLPVNFQSIPPRYYAFFFFRSVRSSFSFPHSSLLYVPRR